MNVAEDDKKTYDPTIKGWNAYVKENREDLEDLRHTVSSKLIKIAGKKY